MGSVTSFYDIGVGRNSLTSEFMVRNDEPLYGLMLKLLCFEWALPDTLFCHSFWHIAWKCIWLMYIYIVPFYLTFFLAHTLIFYLTFFLAYTLTFYLTYFLVYILTFFAAFYLASIVTFYLASILTFYLASILTFFLTFFLAFYLTYVLTFYPAFFWRSTGHIFYAGFCPGFYLTFSLACVGVKAWPIRSWETGVIRRGRQRWRRSEGGLC